MQYLSPVVNQNFLMFNAYSRNGAFVSFPLHLFYGTRTLISPASVCRFGVVVVVVTAVVVRWPVWALQMDAHGFNSRRNTSSAQLNFIFGCSRGNDTVSSNGADVQKYNKKAKQNKRETKNIIFQNYLRNGLCECTSYTCLPACFTLCNAPEMIPVPRFGRDGVAKVNLRSRKAYQLAKI